jgi:hypothetical protein
MQIQGVIFDDVRRLSISVGKKKSFFGVGTVKI